MFESVKGVHRSLRVQKAETNRGVRCQAIADLTEGNLALDIRKHKPGKSKSTNAALT